MCYLDNDSSRWGEIFYGKLIMEPQKAMILNYDYIIIASQYNSPIYSQLIKLGIEEAKIFEYLDFLNNRYNPFEYKIKRFEKEPLKYETLITGISYFVTGIRGEYLNKVGINLAFDSQDLYYDYNIAKYLLTKYENRIKYAIIGLNYYSFQYDLSLSSLKDNVKLYYPRLKKSHNLNIYECDYDRLLINKSIADKILRVTNEGDYELNNESISLTNQKDLEGIGMKQAMLDCKKNYPKTVEENKIILKKYLRLLNNYDIKPIIVICPTSKYYYNYFSDRIKKEFLNLINEIQKEYSFQFIDYFQSDLFDDSLFGDVSHLTYEGGEKFTNILNKVIKW